ncbi:hypothetical protein [Methylobacterium sp. WL116]|uniref:hypothetical protein n=1 Tax=Methylobacterium sp. WL116 TaxID=2603889 RepID=UPI0011C7418E|nr:hypothetical protein [Methylobacterium sp. WL116]TXM90374.1 hypothetical protein FV223_18750 [Methylobacterium sp. WL116]
MDRLDFDARRTRPRLALAQRLIPCPDGGPWTAAKAGTILRRLAGEWMTENRPRLRRGDSVPLELELNQVHEPYEVAVMGEAIVPPAAPAIEPADVIELPLQEAGPRRRAIRI